MFIRVFAVLMKTSTACVLTKEAEGLQLELASLIIYSAIRLLELALGHLSLHNLTTKWLP